MTDKKFKKRKSKDTAPPSKNIMNKTVPDNSLPADIDEEVDQEYEWVSKIKEVGINTNESCETY